MRLSWLRVHLLLALRSPCANSFVLLYHTAFQLLIDPCILKVAITQHFATINDLATLILTLAGNPYSSLSVPWAKYLNIQWVLILGELAVILNVLNIALLTL